jgi:PAS domain S-box-containing protein
LEGKSVDLEGLNHTDIQYLLHELHVHQVELNMQNDELRRVQLELETSRDQYSDLYNFAPTGYCTLSRKGSILEANQTLAVMLGAEREKLIGAPLSQFVDRAGQDAYHLHRHHIFADGERQVSELQMVRPSGEGLAVRMESVIANGDQNQMRVTLSDITERKRTEDALRESQERLHVALENAPISLYTTDRELRYTWIYHPQFGYTLEDILGKRDDELLPAHQVEEITQLKQAVLESGIGRCQVVQFQLGAETKVQNVTAEPLRDKQGEVIGLTVAAMDVTQQRQVEDSVRESEFQYEVQHRLLDQREQERQQIARDLHDGPVQELTASTFALRTLLMGTCSPEMVQQLEAIQASLQAQIHELRNYAGELRPPTLAKFGLEQAIRAHAEIFDEKHPDLHIRLEMHQTGEILPETIGLALFRIYQQALTNALKHAHASEVRVQFEKDEHQAKLEVRDDGQGFEVPNDWLILVREGHLGLLGMRERAEAVGARLVVTSQPGHGTQIRVILPLKGQGDAVGNLRGPKGSTQRAHPHDSGKR